MFLLIFLNVFLASSISRAYNLPCSVIYYRVSDSKFSTILFMSSFSIHEWLSRNFEIYDGKSVYRKGDANVFLVHENKESNFKGRFNISIESINIKDSGFTYSLTIKESIFASNDCAFKEIYIGNLEFLENCLHLINRSIFINAEMKNIFYIFDHTIKDNSHFITRFLFRPKYRYAVCLKLYIEKPPISVHFCSDHGFINIRIADLPPGLFKNNNYVFKWALIINSKFDEYLTILKNLTDLIFYYEGGFLHLQRDVDRIKNTVEKMVRDFKSLNLNLSSKLEKDEEKMKLLPY